MKTLILRLAGPMQSWGTDSKFEIRRTESHPTRSGIIGLLASALGRSREESIEDLSNLKIGVRVDQSGHLITDFQTAKTSNGKDSYITTREYLSDAVFLVAISSDSEEQLDALKEAILHPHFPLFLGRRSCVPTLPIYLGIQDGTVKQVLNHYPWIGSGRKPSHLRIFLEDPNGDFTYRVYDNPISFSIKRRQYSSRIISEYEMLLPPDLDEVYETEHDIFSELEAPK